MSKASSDEHGRSDSVLVRIAERPLVVGGIFFLTAVLPWLVYFAAPGIARAVQTTSVTDLVQWLSLPLLFLAVNGVVLFLWMNHCKNSGGSGGGGVLGGGSVLDGGGGGVFSTGDGDGHGDDWNSVFHAHREAKNVEEIVMDAKRFIAGSGRKEIDRSSSWGTEMEEAVPKKMEAQLRPRRRHEDEKEEVVDRIIPKKMESSRRRHEDEKEEVVDRIIPKKMESSRSRRREERVEDEDEGDRRKMEVSRSSRRRQEEREDGEGDRVASRKMESSRSRRRQEEDLARSRRRQEEEEEQARELDEIRREMELPVKEVKLEIPQRKEEWDREMEFPLRKEEPEEEDEDEDEELEEEREEDREVERIRRELQLPRRDEEKKSYQVPSPPAPAKKKSSNAAAAAAAKSEQLDSIDELRVARSKHKKAHSLKLDEKFLEELHKDQQAQPSPPHRVTRRNSSPAKSRTPTPSLLGLELDPKHVTRRNSSPKTMTMTPTAASMSTSFSSGGGGGGGGGGGYVPPVRPIPLDKDDLNNRIDSFLTKFRMERQESNLRAVLHEE